MGKGERNRAQSARARIAAQQAAARQAEQRRKIWAAAGSVGLVLVIVVAFFVVKGLSSTPKQQGTSAALASVQQSVTSVPASTLASVGTGALAPMSQLPIKAITNTPLTSGGKPEMLYIGAEFCPYCAATRWAMAVALSRFGTLGPVHWIHSSSTDVDPNTPTLTFYKTTYTSQYLSFVPIENETVTHKQLQPVSKAQMALWVKYDSTGGSVGYPFIDFGNKVIITGPFFDPLVLKGLTWAQVAADMQTPGNTVAKNIDGEANYITAAICKITGNSPASVCSVASVSSIEAKL